MPSSITAEQILVYGKRQSRSLQLDGNVVAYFGQIFQKSATLGTGGRNRSVRRTVGGRIAAAGVDRPLPE